eukprot:716060-Amphidinium_carterae.1
MAAVQQTGWALQFAAAGCKADHQIVMAAVQQTGCALGFAAKECKADRQIVLEAVQQNGWALGYAAAEWKRDREIVLAAVQQSRGIPGVIKHAADELLLDSTFAPEAKSGWHILKVSLLSGRSTVVMADGSENTLSIVGACFRRLAIHQSRVKLLHGTEVLRGGDKVMSWPGLRPKGQVSEYQLVMGAQ